MLPGIDGIETLRILRDDPSFAGVPVVFLTARVTERDIQTCLDAGATDVIRKPFDPITLAEQLHAIWRRWSQDRRGE